MKRNEVLRMPDSLAEAVLAPVVMYIFYLVAIWAVGGWNVK